MVSATEDVPTASDRQIEQLAKLGPGAAEETRMTEAGLMTINSAGRVTTYHTLTGEPTPCNRNMLLSHLRKMLPDRRPAYTLDDPGFRPKLGTVKCLLHPEARLPEYDGYGFPVCMSAHLANRYQMRRHMKHRHGDVFEAIELMEQERRKEEERQFQRNLLSSVKGKGSEFLDAIANPEVTSEMAKAIVEDAVETVTQADTIAEVVYGTAEQGPEPVPDSAEVYAQALTRPAVWPPELLLPPYECQWPGCKWTAERAAKRRKKPYSNPKAALVGHMKLHRSAV